MPPRADDVSFARPRNEDEAAESPPRVAFDSLGAVSPTSMMSIGSDEDRESDPTNDSLRAISRAELMLEASFCSS